MRPPLKSVSSPEPSRDEGPAHALSAYQGAAGYLIAVLLSVLLGSLAVHTQRSIVQAKDRVEGMYEGELLEVERLRAAAGQKALGSRGYLLTGNSAYLEEREAARRQFLASLDSLANRVTTPSERALVERIIGAQDAYHAATDRTVVAHREGRPPEEVARVFEREAAPRLDELTEAIDALAADMDARLERAQTEAAEATTRAARRVLLVAGGAILLAVVLGVLFFRSVERSRRAAEERLAALEREQRARREAEAARSELAATVQRLEEVNADLDAFAGRIAHDLRNVLAPIALVPALLGSSRDQQSLARIAASLVRTSARAQGILDGLLAFSRAGKPTEGSHAASLNEVITEVVEELSPLAADVDAELSIDVGEGHVACSPDLLHVVVLNLLSNALKYIGGRERREVRIRGRSEADGVRISVEDTGPGIPKDVLGRIFEPFYRVPGVSAPGTGIGLATVRRIVLAHGGRVECSSEPGKGAKFDVWLPCAPPGT